MLSDTCVTRWEARLGLGLLFFENLELVVPVIEFVARSFERVVLADLLGTEGRDCFQNLFCGHVVHGLFSCEVGCNDAEH